MLAQRQVQGAGPIYRLPLRFYAKSLVVLFAVYCLLFASIHDSRFTIHGV